MTTNEEIQMGRAKNAVLTFLENRLIVPKIYLDADWGGHQVDVLAIERDGVGDVHIALVFPRPQTATGQPNGFRELEAIGQLIDRFQSIPAQFKYITAVDINAHVADGSFGLPQSLVEKSFSPDGLGRVGFLTVDAPLNGEPQVRMPYRPERFRAKIAKLADEYVQQHEADWEIRA